MGRLFIHLIILLIVFSVNLQGQPGKRLLKKQHKADTTSARFSMCETIRGDTVMFKFPSTYEGLRRHFQRNLRYPADIETDSVETTLCRLYFLIDTAGLVTEVWCAAGPPEPLAKEVIRIAKKLGAFVPGYIKGRPVVTRVETRIVYYDMHQDEQKIIKKLNYEADILVGAGILCRLPARPRVLDRR
jgi:hypothetical protein